MAVATPCQSLAGGGKRRKTFPKDARDSREDAAPYLHDAGGFGNDFKSVLRHFHHGTDFSKDFISRFSHATQDSKDIKNPRCNEKNSKRKTVNGMPMLDWW